MENTIEKLLRACQTNSRRYNRNPKQRKEEGEDVGHWEAWKQGITRRLPGAVTTVAHSDTAITHYSARVTVQLCLNM